MCEKNMHLCTNMQLKSSCWSRREKQLLISKHMKRIIIVLFLFLFAGWGSTVHASGFVACESLQGNRDTALRYDTVSARDMPSACTNLLKEGWNVLEIERLDDFAILKSCRLGEDPYTRSLWERCPDGVLPDGSVMLPDGRLIEADGVYESQIERSDGTKARVVKVIEGGKLKSLTCDGKLIIPRSK